MHTYVKIDLNTVCTTFLLLVLSLGIPSGCGDDESSSADDGGVVDGSPGDAWLDALPVDGAPGDDARVHEWVTEEVEANRVEFRTFESAAIGQEVSYHIFVPQPYDNMEEEDFPVLYWLHGGGGGLPGIPVLSQHFAQAMQAGLIPVMLVVFPNGLELGMWVDWKDGSVPMETIVIHELIPHIDETFRTIADRSGRIVEGFSMGGYGAARFAFKHHELFSAASILGGGPLQPEFVDAPRVDPERREQVFRDVYGEDMDYFYAVSPWGLAEENAEEIIDTVRIRIAIGELDATFQFNLDFHEHLTALGIPHEFFAAPDVGHDTMNLRNAMGDELWDFYVWGD